MIADFRIALGRGHAGASLAFERSPRDGGRASHWPAIAGAALTLPFAVALALNAIANYTHAFSYESIPAWLLGGDPPGWGRVMSLGPPLALVLIAAARLRFHIRHEEGRWIGAFTAHLDRWEIAVGVLALSIAGVFIGHLAADAFACANRVTHAC